MILYHGSSSIVEKPVYGKGKTYNDYGSGFYCTEHRELAMEWSCNEGTDGYVNRYELDLSDLRVLRLTSGDYTILNWLAILMENRIGRLSGPIAKRGREYLLQNFLPDYKEYDVIIGYRADDSYFSFARAFVENGISLRQLSKAMRLGELGEQVVLKSQKAFETIRFMDYETTDHAGYDVRRKSRDENARRDYEKESEQEDLDGIFLRDIIREGMKQDDPRLR